MALLLQGPAPWSIVSNQPVRLKGRTPNVATSQAKQDAAQQQASDQHVHPEKMPAEQVVGERTRSRRTFRPPVDIYETEQGLMLLADVPGATPEGLQITLERRVLNVWA